jgi:hypothetical protein
MALLAQPVVADILGDLVDDIRSAFFDALDDYHNYPDWARATHCATTTANNVHSHIRDRISKLAAQHSARLRVQVIRKMFVLVVDNKIAIRFKKLDDDLQTANMPTDQVVAFKGQQPLEGLDVICHLEAGYQLDATGQAIQATFLMHPNGVRNYWTWQLDNDQQDVVTDLFPTEPDEPDDDGALIRPIREGNVIDIEVGRRVDDEDEE